MNMPSVENNQLSLANLKCPKTVAMKQVLINLCILCIKSVLIPFI